MDGLSGKQAAFAAADARSSGSACGLHWGVVSRRRVTREIDPSGRVRGVGGRRCVFPAPGTKKSKRTSTRTGSRSRDFHIISVTRYRLCHPSRLADVKILTIQCVPSGASQRRKRSNALPCQWTRHRARDAPRAPPPPHAPTGTGRLALTPAAGVPVPGRQPGVKPAPVAQLSAGERRARCWCWCCRRPWSAGPGDGRGPCSPGCAMRERARHGWCRELLGPRSTTFCCRAAVGIYLSSSSATKA